MCYQIMCRLNFTIYDMSVRPQGNGAMTTDIILQNKLLPKVVLRRSEMVSLEKKCTTLTKAKNGKHITKSFKRFLSKEKGHTTERLKVQSVILNRI